MTESPVHEIPLSEDGRVLLDVAEADEAADTTAFSGVATIDVADRRVYERVAGFAHRGHGVPLTSDTRLGIASGSKVFTALAVLRLVEEGRLALDAPVRPLLGDDLPLIDEAVTIEHLLTHTSGIGDYLDESADGEIDDYILAVPVHTLTTAEAFLPVLDGFPQAFPPGERFAYCNGGYVVLALIIERVTGEPFHEVVRRLVFEPAGLARTDHLRLDELPGDAAVGYLYDQGDRANTLHLPVLGNGDGGAFTTAADMHAFWRSLVSGGIVSAGTYAEMIRPRHDVEDEEKRFGLGLWLHESADVLIAEGYDAGVSFWSAHVPAADTTVTVIANTSEGAWPVAGALLESLEAVLPALTDPERGAPVSA